MLGSILTLGATATAGILGWGLFHPRSRLCARPLHHAADPGCKSVAITFDDGPDPRSTPDILQILSEHQVPAAFFVIGRYAAAQPDLIRAIHEQGHTLGNHSFDHHTFGLLGTGGYWADQIDRTNAVISATIGVTPRFFRPPMGFKHWRMDRAVIDRNMRMITWSRRGGDGVVTTRDRVISRLETALPGEILALHDGVSSQTSRDPRVTVAALEPILVGLRKRGMVFASLDTMLADPAAG